ncbi:hypothetical protein LINGRAHAP2_LOCUS30568 [Linum grandiflorum]
MGCLSFEEKKRIMGLKNRNFESFLILTDDWIPEVGQSNVLAQRRMCWLQVGIPIHLRSKELFKAISDLCGNFLESYVANWFQDGVLLKVFIKDSIPDEVIIRYKFQLFSVSVVVERHRRRRGRVEKMVRN